MVLPVTEYTGHTIAFPSLGLTPHRMMWFLSPSQYLFFLFQLNSIQMSSTFGAQDKFFKGNLFSSFAVYSWLYKVALLHNSK